MKNNKKIYVQEPKRKHVDIISGFLKIVVKKIVEVYVGIYIFINSPICSCHITEAEKKT